MAVLTELLAGRVAEKPGVLSAFRLAKRDFLAGQRVDMGRLSDELRVSRMTLNRWVGSRDLLLAEVIWSVAEPALEQARARSVSTGPNLVADVASTFLTWTLAAPYMQSLLSREPAIALRVLTTNCTPVQERLSRWFAGLIDDQIPARRRPLPAEDLGYLIVRIAESFGYIDLIAGGTPDPDKARQAIAALLH